MSDSVLYIGIGVLVASGLAVQLMITHRRHERGHRKDLEPILKAHELTFVSSRWPGRLKVGPFPKFEIKKLVVPRVVLAEFAASMMNTGSLPFKIRKVKFKSFGRSWRLKFFASDGLGGVQRTV